MKAEIVAIPKIEDPRGSLSFIQQGVAVDFVPRRVFYLYDVPAGASRGGHAHHQARELIIALSGAFDVVLDDGREKQTFRLDRPNKGLFVSNGLWREIENFSGGAVCLVVTSEDFSEADYIRDYNEFLASKK